MQGLREAGRCGVKVWTVEVYREAGKVSRSFHQEYESADAAIEEVARINEFLARMGVTEHWFEVSIW